MTIKGLFLLKIIKIFSSKSISLISALKPSLPFFSKYFLPFLRPNLILALSADSQLKYEKLGCKSIFLPLGVDVNKFKPVSPIEKNRLKEKYGFNKDNFLILHVGSIKEERNVQFFKELKKEDVDILIIGRITAGTDQKLLKELRNSGCSVWVDYYNDIQNIYAMADCYIFPTIKKIDIFGRNITSSIDLPLSVFEAVACNLPVIATRFESLEMLFSDIGGVYFADNLFDFQKLILTLKTKGNIDVRSHILSYS
jgi:glycosyltransferase involved in cell wall biosynthesis